jgi:hypothetical protein
LFPPEKLPVPEGTNFSLILSGQAAFREVEPPGFMPGGSFLGKKFGLCPVVRRQVATGISPKRSVFPVRRCGCTFCMFPDRLLDFLKKALRFVNDRMRGPVRTLTGPEPGSRRLGLKFSEDVQKPFAEARRDGLHRLNGRIGPTSSWCCPSAEAENRAQPMPGRAVLIQKEAEKQ